MTSVGEEAVMERDQPWTVDRERTMYALQVVLPKRTYVLPWTQFLYADGLRPKCARGSRCTMWSSRLRARCVARGPDDARRDGAAAAFACGEVRRLHAGQQGGAWRRWRCDERERI